MSSSTLPVGGGGRLPSQRFRRDDRDFLSGVQGADTFGPKRSAYILLVAVVSFFVVAVIWASIANLEEVTRGEGRVIPSSKVQKLQNLEGGILREILVREGQIVEQGEVLLRIDNVTAASEYAESQARYHSLLASISRLEAEIAEGPLEFPEEVLNNAPDVAAAERSLFTTRQSQLQSEVAILERQVEQRQQEVAELNSRANQLSRSLALAREELAITEPLARRQIVSKVELLRLQREVNDLDGQLEQTQLSIPRAESALSEANRRIEERFLAFRSEATKERNALATELAGLREMIGAESDRVRRTEVRSPVRGTIKQLLINTVGGVIQPGKDLIEIVPLEDTLLIEAQVRPADIAFLSPGLPATVKVTAYDFSIYGGLDGEVEGISADTITDERGESFYKVLVHTETNQLERNGEILPIIPGMTVQVDVLTGEKTVLDYILKPILKVRDNALRER
ncbi:MAG: HlyD family type I secretion periplasmic adaptor subunit [Geminicoccaceae bacterium]